MRAGPRSPIPLNGRDKNQGPAKNFPSVIQPTFSGRRIGSPEQSAAQLIHLMNLLLSADSPEES